MPGHEMKQSQSRYSEMEPLLDGNAAARLLHIHPVTLAEMARQGRIPAIKIGRVWRFRASSLERWLDAHEQRQKEPA